jgi:hypothetical protein
MKKPLLIVIVILVVIFALPAFKFFQWSFKSKKPMNVIVIDKTSSTLDREKHKSLIWVLTNDKVVKKTNRSSYSFRKDYFGFMPKRPLRERKWDKLDLRLANVFKFADSCDVLYVADTYGVYFNDWYTGMNKSRRSRRLYGGTNSVDFLYIKEMHDRNKLVILEYNTFDYPTPDLEKWKITTQLLGIKYDGWIGKYFASLDTTSNPDFPIWMSAMYRKQYSKPWTFTKPGVVFMKEREIIVLEEGTHLKSAMPQITTDSVICAKYGLVKRVAFDGWFDVIDPLNNKVLSKFNLETTSVGETLLYENYLSNTFPAVIADSSGRQTYYFSGDFATNKVPYWAARFEGIEKFKGIFYSDKQDDPRRFFWLYYRPLITGIFGDYYSTLKKK